MDIATPTLGQLSLFGDLATVSAPTATDTMSRISKADIRLFKKISDNSGKKLKFHRAEDGYFKFDDKESRMIFSFSEDVIISILEGKSVAIGEWWIQTRR